MPVSTRLLRTKIFPINLTETYLGKPIFTKTVRCWIVKHDAFKLLRSYHGVVLFNFAIINPALLFSDFDCCSAVPAEPHAADE